METSVPVRKTDEEIIRSFPRYEGPAVPGCVVDFLGTRTRKAYIKAAGIDHDVDLVEDYPVEGNFHSTGMEWAGSLRAVLEAANQLVVVELGAGWGPWLVSLARAAQLRGIQDVRLVGVEGSKGHFEYLRSHFADNGLDPDAHTLLHAVVGPRDGVAEFPVLTDPSADYGAQAIFKQSKRATARKLPQLVRQLAARVIFNQPGRAAVHRPATEKVPCLSLATLLRPFTEVDLIHFDIQGAETEVIESSYAVLKEKVKRIVIGTHGRAIEQKLLDGLAAQSWELEAEKSCQYVQSGSAMSLYQDGVQVWRNADLGWGEEYQLGSRIDFA